MARSLLAILAVTLLIAMVLLWQSGEEITTETPLAVSSLLGDADTAGLGLADPSYRPSFPEDHGPHPDFRSEWWYFTGNLNDTDGHPFGFQFTIFRFALSGEPVRRSSRWATRQAWMAHLAVTDADETRFYRAERFARGGEMGLAGAVARPFAAWVGDWRMAADNHDLLPMNLSARAEDFGLSLTLEPGRGPVLQGEEGYSRKGPGVGNASHYYSYTRLPVSGELFLDDRTVAVTGEAWLDREWGTSALGPEVRGWDWFSLQLDDGTELMYYQLRRGDGSADPLSAGSVTGPMPRSLRSAEVELTPTRYWHSPDTGAAYPVGWQISVPSEDLRLNVEALLDEQEMVLSVNYWEGAVRALGTRKGLPISGRGYLEMTGYESDEIIP